MTALSGTHDATQGWRKWWAMADGPTVFQTSRARICFGPTASRTLNVENPVFVLDRCNKNDDSIAPYLILVEFT